MGDLGPTSAAAPCNDIRDEAARLAAAAAEDGIGLRLMGGLAIWLTSPSARRPPYAREYQDIDFAAPSRDARRITPFLTTLGYVPERMFNALHGAQRLNFGHPDGCWTIDVVIDELAMSHRLDLRGRLDPGNPTLDLADLLLTKLQVFEINRKDLGDIACLLADHELADGPAADAIDRRRVIAVTSGDWGWCHTVEQNLTQVEAQARAEPPTGAPLDASRQAESLLGAVRASSKSLGWRARARLGERVRWYETPEEVRH
jgi:hypothetical protein